MTEITQDKSKSAFGTLASSWSVADTARSILDAFITFYRETRIKGAGIGDDDYQDMFSIEFSPKNELIIYRTIHAVDDLPDDSEFDDDGFNLTVEMQFDGLPNGDDWLGETELSSPSILDQKLPAMLTNERLAKVLEMNPTSMECHVGGAG